MMQMALEGHDSRYGYHHQTFGIHLVVLTAHWAFNMRAHVLCYWVNIPQPHLIPHGTPSHWIASYGPRMPVERLYYLKGIPLPS